MTLKRSEFWKWMDSCPMKEETKETEGWFQAADDGEGIRIYFPVDEDEDKEEEDVSE